MKSQKPEEKEEEEGQLTEVDVAEGASLQEESLVVREDDTEDELKEKEKQLKVAEQEMVDKMVEDVACEKQTIEETVVEKDNSMTIAYQDEDALATTMIQNVVVDIEKENPEEEKKKDEKGKQKVTDQEEENNPKRKNTLKIKFPRVNSVEEKDKRLEKIGDQLKSPYVQRKLNINEKPTATESRVANWIFSFQGNIE